MQLPFHWVGCRFDGMDPAKELAAPLKLKSVEQWVLDLLRSASVLTAVAGGIDAKAQTWKK
jgi:hypothetical protein